MMEFETKELEQRVRQYVSEKRFRHILSMTEMALSLAKCHGVDTGIVRITAMLHDIAKDMTPDEMMTVAEKYGHNISELSLRVPDNMHAEVGALIAEHEFGLKDVDALNAIRYHYSARPDMSILEKIIFFSDSAEPNRPNYAITQYLYRIAKTDLDEALLRGLRVRLEYQYSRNTDKYTEELLNNAFDYLLEEKLKKKSTNVPNPERALCDTLSDEEFDKALDVVMTNGIKLKSVKNIRFLGNVTTSDGQYFKSGKIIRSAELSRLTTEDGEYLKEHCGLSLVIDMRSLEEVCNKPDVLIPGVRYEHIPLGNMPDSERIKQLTFRYQQSETNNERAWYLAEFARIDEVRKMYQNISSELTSKEALRKIFQLISENDGTTLFHCTSGKDRTGIMAALFMYALGCSTEDIINDYNASAISYMALAESFKFELQEHGYNKELQMAVQTILSVVPEIIASGFYYIESNYSGNQRFIAEKIGFGWDNLERLKKKYLTSAIR